MHIKNKFGLLFYIIPIYSILGNALSNKTLKDDRHCVFKYQTL